MSTFGALEVTTKLRSSVHISVDPTPCQRTRLDSCSMLTSKVPNLGNGFLELAILTTAAGLGWATMNAFGLHWWNET